MLIYGYKCIVFDNILATFKVNGLYTQPLKGKNKEILFRLILIS